MKYNYVFFGFQNTNFCGSAESQKRRPISELIYNCVMGLVLVFDIVNVKDGPTRYKHAFYYSLVLVEDGILLAFWYIESGGNHVSTVNLIFYHLYPF